MSAEHWIFLFIPPWQKISPPSEIFLNVILSKHWHGARLEGGNVMPDLKIAWEEKNIQMNKFWLINGTAQAKFFIIPLLKIKSKGQKWGANPPYPPPFKLQLLRNVVFYTNLNLKGPSFTQKLRIRKIHVKSVNT